ncbi:hypothetical protein EJ05DRAFT_191475 [Pseudovirgaria hyperparasitica]|uniref:Uncharacterized protein n=1 Tax=Pseudovirgaria hyperparasitica TaxID=470096 RepID=A0A6A6WIS4_9PEZI|nr:uncharacterized protein EJ05DRAFT_191475 [Pseudovirgaria hyperparasitica]KAF2761970.1 hypothetical protein EJ05DRAFT_191475 [Pseudovirgaria hyperparasitica]
MSLVRWVPRGKAPLNVVMLIHYVRCPLTSGLADDAPVNTIPAEISPPFMPEEVRSICKGRLWPVWLNISDMIYLNKAVLAHKHDEIAVSTIVKPVQQAAVFN